MYSNKHIYIILMTFTLFYSCERERIIEDYYSNGGIKKMKKYNANGQLERVVIFDSINKSNQIFFYSNNKLDSLVSYDADSSKVFKKEILSKRLYQTNFHKNGNIKSKGYLINDTLKNGWWSYFDTYGGLKSKRQYTLLCDNYYLNQSIIFDENSDTIFKKDDFNETIYFNYDIKENGIDTMIYEISPISYRSKLELVFLKENEFCEEEGNIDLIIKLEKRKGKISLNKLKRPYSGFVFDYYIDTTFVEGKKKINSVSRKIYFDTASKILDSADL